MPQHFWIKLLVTYILLNMKKALYPYLVAIVLLS